jgi:hypothetical protein
MVRRRRAVAVGTRVRLIGGGRLVTSGRTMRLARVAERHGVVGLWRLVGLGRPIRIVRLALPWSVVCLVGLGRLRCFARVGRWW